MGASWFLALRRHIYGIGMSLKIVDFDQFSGQVRNEDTRKNKIGNRNEPKKRYNKVGMRKELR